MKKFLSTACAATLAISFAATGKLPANAAPLAIPQAPAAQSSVIDVQLTVEDLRANRGVYRDFRRDRRDFRRDRRDWRRAVRRGNLARPGEYWNGHRGYRYHRPGYRRHGDLWFPLAAFAAGAIISGAINQPSVRYRGGGSHVEWCYNRYRSYRDWDNTWQPYVGDRRQCDSPYS